jgi:dihydropteroate synthase
VLEDPVSRVLEFEGFIDFVDVGAMSTAPYLDAWIPVEKELERVRGVLPDIVRGVRIPVSIDTFRPQVAEYVSYTRRCAVSWLSMMLQLY